LRTLRPELARSEEISLARTFGEQRRRRLGPRVLSSRLPARRGRQPAGTSCYAAPVRADAPALNDTEELDRATVAALRARTCERVRRLRAKVAAEAALLAAAPATEPMSSPLVPNQLTEPAILDSAQPRAPNDNSVRATGRPFEVFWKVVAAVRDGAVVLTDVDHEIVLMSAPNGTTPCR